MQVGGLVAEERGQSVTLMNLKYAITLREKASSYLYVSSKKF